MEETWLMWPCVLWSRINDRRVCIRSLVVQGNSGSCALLALLEAAAWKSQRPTGTISFCQHGQPERQVGWCRVYCFVLRLWWKPVISMHSSACLNRGDFPCPSLFCLSLAGVFWLDRPMGIIPPDSFMVVTVLFGPMSPINYHKKATLTCVRELSNQSAHFTDGTPIPLDCACKNQFSWMSNALIADSGRF